MEQHSNKTIMCSVMMLDIVGYSKKSVSDQISSKEVFNTMLGAAIKDVPENDRVILDTGDGAAITFLGDIEDALKAVLAFRDSLLSEGANMAPPLEVCMGINLGPVRLVKDINGRANIVGDGINVAQRVMGFAKGGQILVSRSYFDAASRLSHEYAGMFYHEGSRADKHGRDHEIYAIGQPGVANPDHQSGEDTLGIAVKQATAAPAEDKLQGAVDTFKNASGQQRALYAGIGVTALALVIVIAMKFTSHPEVPPVTAELPAAPAAPSAPEAVTAPPAPTEIQAQPEPKNESSANTSASPNAAEPAPARKTKAARLADPAGTPGKDSKPINNNSAATSRPPAETTAAAPAADSKPAAKANLSFAVAPWGEIYLDGKKQGVSPPMDSLSVTPGSHEIEIRNTAFPPYTMSIQVQADEQLKIKHKFTN